MSPVYEGLVRAALWFAAIFALTALALAVIRKIRSGEVEGALDQNQLMTTFRDLHDRGGLSDDEFRTIKTKLASELKAKLNDSGKTG